MAKNNPEFEPIDYKARPRRSKCITCFARTEVYGDEDSPLAGTYA